MLYGDEKPLTELMNRLPLRNGRKVHRNTVHRWIHHGCKGILLEARRIGGVWYSTQEAFDRFFEALSQPAALRRQVEPEVALLARRKQVAQAREWLKEEGFYGDSKSTCRRLAPKAISR